MPLRSAVRMAVSLIVPPRCAVCSAPCALDQPLCVCCDRELDSARSSAVAVNGVGTVIAAAPYEGVARGLIGSLKFGRRPALALRAASSIAAALPDDTRGDVVPVPPAPARLRDRGFDPAEAIAVGLARALDLTVSPCLARSDGPRQVGRARAARLADPPQVRLICAPPRRTLLVDDVLTTGATLAACARVLTGGGCRELVAASFARSAAGGSSEKWAETLGVRRV